MEKRIADKKKNSNAHPKNRDWVWSLKRTSYSLLATNWRSTVKKALLFGLLCSLLFTGFNYYQGYAAASATVSIVYPEIADGTYPDGSRFTMYSFADEAAVSDVLEDMQAEGKYTFLTVEDLMQGISVTAVMDSSVGETVTSMQSEGNDYSYYSSEYRIGFTQPRVGERFSPLQFFESDHSMEFLQRLVQYKQTEIAELSGGYFSFERLTGITVPDTLDYDEWVTSFDTNNRIIRGFLREIGRTAGDFHSFSTGKSINDLVGLFTTMGEERLSEISNYIKNSGLTKDRESFLNKLNAQIENTTLKYSKAQNEAAINRYAMDRYDHTFTENLLIVATSEVTGLYQARPKTVFDTVADQYNDANDLSIQYASDLRDMQEDLTVYQGIEENSAEYRRIVARCETLIDDYEADYRSLCETARATLADYLAVHNNGYLSYKVETDPLFSLSFVFRIAAVFVVGALVVVMLHIMLTPLNDRRELSRRRRKMQRIPQGQDVSAVSEGRSSRKGKRTTAK